MKPPKTKRKAVRAWAAVFADTGSQCEQDSVFFEKESAAYVAKLFSGFAYGSTVVELIERDRHAERVLKAALRAEKLRSAALHASCEVLMEERDLESRRGSEWMEERDEAQKERDALKAELADPAFVRLPREVVERVQKVMGRRLNDCTPWCNSNNAAAIFAPQECNCGVDEDRSALAELSSALKEGK